jgi:hypothetical protein
MALTVKQEAAAQAYIENGGNQSEAYRTAFDAEKMAQETIWKEACVLFKNPKVAVRVIELQEEHRIRHNVTVDTLTKELDEARSLAKDEAQPSAMTGATMGKAKLHGLITDKKESKVTLNAEGEFLAAIQPTTGLPNDRDN